MKQDMSAPEDLIDSEATQLLKAHGDQACEVARQAARTARNKRDHRQARHFSQLALRIVELTKPEIATE